MKLDLHQVWCVKLHEERDYRKVVDYPKLGLENICLVESEQLVEGDVIYNTELNRLNTFMCIDKDGKRMLLCDPTSHTAYTYMYINRKSIGGNTFIKVLPDVECKQLDIGWVLRVDKITNAHLHDKVVIGERVLIPDKVNDHRFVGHCGSWEMDVTYRGTQQVQLGIICYYDRQNPLTWEQREKEYENRIQKLEKENAELREKIKQMALESLKSDGSEVEHRKNERRARVLMELIRDYFNSLDPDEVSEILEKVGKNS